MFAKHRTISGQKVFDELKRFRIIVRHFSSPLVLDDWNRITIGSAEQMQVFLEVMNGVVEHETR